MLYPYIIFLYSPSIIRNYLQIRSYLFEKSAGNCIVKDWTKAGTKYFFFNVNSYEIFYVEEHDILLEIINLISCRNFWKVIVPFFQGSSWYFLKLWKKKCRKSKKIIFWDVRNQRNIYDRCKQIRVLRHKNYGSFASLKFVILKNRTMMRAVVCFLTPFTF